VTSDFGNFWMTAVDELARSRARVVAAGQRPLSDAEHKRGRVQPVGHDAGQDARGQHHSYFIWGQAAGRDQVVRAASDIPSTPRRISQVVKHIHAADNVECFAVVLALTIVKLKRDVGAPHLIRRSVGPSIQLPVRQSETAKRRATSHV